MYKRQRMNEDWTGDWKGIVKDRVDNPWNGDDWVPWNVPEKVYDLVEPRVMELEELILCGTYPGDTRLYRTGLLRCRLEGCPCYGKKLRTYVNSTKTDRRAVKAMCDKHKLKYPLTEEQNNLISQQMHQTAVQKKASAKLNLTQEVVAICADIMTKLSKHDLPRDFWTTEEMFVFIYGLVERKQRGEPVTEITIEEHLQSVKVRHVLRNQTILAIGNEPRNQLTEAQIMELTTINSEQVKVEPMDAENDGTLIQEINVEDDDGNDISLNNINQPVNLSESFAKLIAYHNATLASTNSTQISIPSDDRPSNPTVIASSTEASLVAEGGSANIAAATTLTSNDAIGDSPELENTGEKIENGDDKKQKESDAPKDAEIPQYPGSCTDLFGVYKRWESILTNEAKEKLFADFSLNKPLYQNPDEIEDVDLKLTIRDEWIAEFPSWLANFKPLNSIDDGSKQIPLSDIIAMRQMYRTELEARHTPVK